MAAWLWAIPAEHYSTYVKTGTFAIRKVGRGALEAIRPGDVLFAYLSGSKVIAGMFEAVGAAFEDATPLVASGHYPHRLRVRPVITLTREAWVPYDAFHDSLAVSRDYPDFGAVVRQVIHPLPTVDAKVLEFLVRAREAASLDKVLEAYDAYLTAKEKQDEPAPQVEEPPAAYEPTPFDRAGAMEALIAYVEAQGFVYEPWEVAAYVTALRTKPFVILAGVTGAGKSRLPKLVEAGTGGRARLVPVRPNWADSADVLGYQDLAGHFRPGAVLQAAREAQQRPDRHLTCIVDEMNVARVEHYFAEVLSRMEDRQRAAEGGYESTPLLDLELAPPDAAWQTVGLAPNLALVGTVNMDESAHGFSRKVLDRAFTLELTEVDLGAWHEATEAVPSARWPIHAWYPRAAALAEALTLSAAERALVARVIEELVAANTLLAPAQAQVAYRTRDEVVLFMLHAAETPDAFRTRAGEAVDPLDLALHMKVLPRLAGGSHALRYALRGLLGWAMTGSAFTDDADVRPVLDAWEATGRPHALPDARFPRTTARLCLMWERLATEGFTSFWV